MKQAIATQQFKCLECGQSFAPGSWTCADGQSMHRVESKTYRMTDAPADPDRTAPGTPQIIVRGRTVITKIPPPTKVIEGGEVRWVGEGSVEFVNGRYSTDNPEQQYWLNKKPFCNATEEQWKRAWLTKEELLAEKELDLLSMQSRLEIQQNELLSQTKERVSARG